MDIIVEANIGQPVVVETSESSANVVVAATQGPPGPQGPPGTAVQTQPIAASENISAYCAVAVVDGEAVQASSANPAHMGNVVGIATGGALAGATVTVMYSGVLEYNGWNFTLGEPVFLGVNGALTQVAPAAGFSQVVGIPINATTLLVQMQPAITIQ